MISEAEIRRFAAVTQVDPMVIDLDYSLGWFLLGMLKTSSSLGGLIFKGGTCLRKCYFPDYRFSEDLDFTASRFLSPSDFNNWIVSIVDWIDDHDGPDFRVQPIHFEVVDDEYGSESYQARIYYRGALRWGGSPRTVKIDVTRSEKVLLPPNEKQILHSYSDNINFVNTFIPCYSLEEVVAEKIRAIVGQRRFAISRNLYDIQNLVSAGVDLKTIRQILPEKFAIRGLCLSGINTTVLKQRCSEFERDWNHRLRYLVTNQGADFETAWQCVIQLINDVLS